MPVFCQYVAGLNFGYLIPHLKDNKISTSAFDSILCQVDIGIRTGHDIEFWSPDIRAWIQPNTVSMSAGKI